MPRPLPVPLRAALGLLVAATLLGVVEGILRAADLPDAGLYEGDPRGLWQLRPNLDRTVEHPSGPFEVNTTALGIRGPSPPPSGDWTLALGCSTTFGWGVEAGEAWPGWLSKRLGEPVVNAGVPGWSSHQATLGAQRWLDLRPSRVVLAYLVRDAWPAQTPDHAATPTPWLLRTHLARLLGAARRPTAGRSAGRLPATPPAAARVPPDRYVQNLRELVEAAEPAEVWVLAFPVVEPAAVAPWVEAARSLPAPLLQPALPRSAFFDADPVHLTPAGHRALADAIAEALESGAR